MPCNTFICFINFFFFPSFTSKLATHLFICYIKNFISGKIRMKSFEFCFYLQPNKSEKKLLTRNGTLQNIFSSMVLHCSDKSEHVLSAQKKGFFGICWLIRIKTSKYRRTFYSWTSPPWQIYLSERSNTSFSEVHLSHK